MRPPRPILPRKVDKPEPSSVGGRDGGIMPKAASLSESRGFVKSMIGSSGSCNIYNKLNLDEIPNLTISKCLGLITNRN